VITDEQTSDIVPRPAARLAYMVNVGSDSNGVGYRDGWTHVDGFSEHVLRFIAEHERL
jgi:60 kDa SS-A/Ro ribonucleoprotein